MVSRPTRRLLQRQAEHGNVGEERLAIGGQFCNELIDWFVRQSIRHDAAIKAFFDDRGTRFAGRARQRKTS